MQFSDNLCYFEIQTITQHDLLQFCWTLEVCRTASYEITLICLSSVRPSVCPRVRPSVLHKVFSRLGHQFFLIQYMMIVGHNIQCLTKPGFLKKKKKNKTKQKIMTPQIQVKWTKIGPQTRFFAIFSSLVHWFSLKLHTMIACNNV